MSPTSPRFRFRDPRGREVEVASVEELAQRVAQGEVEEHTPLFDAGTGLWQEAGQLPVFRFVVEELKEEGKLPAGEGEPEPGPGGVAEEEETPPPLPLTPDPFELHLPLRSTIGGGEEFVPEKEEGGEEHPVGPEPEDPATEARGAGEPDSPEDPPPEWRSELLEGLDDVVGDLTPGGPESAGGPDGTDGGGPGLEGEGITWGLPLPAREPRPEEPGAPSPRGRGTDATEGSGGVEAEDDAVDPREETPPPPPFPLAPRPRAPSRPRDRRRPAAEPPSPVPVGEVGEAESPDPFRDAPRATPRPESVLPVGARRRDRRVLGAFGLVGALLLVVAGVMVVSSGEEVVPPDPLAAVPEMGDVPPSAPGAPIPPPPELEASTEGILAALALSMGAWADSLRQEAELDDGPPRGWLGGFYLSNAGDFPQVPEFWQAYRDFLGELRDGDAERYRRASLEAAADHLPPGVEPTLLEGYLAERYAVLGPLRTDRYATLIRVSEAAEALHHFLVESQERIVHAPALGRGISPDPILEAVPTDEETRDGLDARLDTLFQLLDRSRGGGPPSFEGLRADLFERFHQPV